MKVDKTINELKNISHEERMLSTKQSAKQEERNARETRTR